VSFETSVLVSRLAEPFPESWQFVTDLERGLYTEYGVGNASPLRLLSPRAIWVYVRALFSGRLLSLSSRGDGQRADTAQLGADFVVGGDGRIALAWVSKTPADRPRMKRLRAALDG